MLLKTSLIFTESPLWLLLHNCRGAGSYSVSPPERALLLENVFLCWGHRPSAQKIQVFVGLGTEDQLSACLEGQVPSSFKVAQNPALEGYKKENSVRWASKYFLDLLSHSVSFTMGKYAIITHSNLPFTWKGILTQWLIYPLALTWSITSSKWCTNIN